MKSNISRLPGHMLLLGALCASPLTAMAINPVANHGFDSVVHPRQTWLSQAGPSGWARDSFSPGALHLAERDDPRSFAHATRERTPGLITGGAEFSPRGAAGREHWPASFLSEPASPSVFAAVTTPVPEPGTYVLMMAGLAAIGFAMRRRRRI
jgi:hypothetical protein